MNSKRNLAIDSFAMTFVQCLTLITGIIQTMLLSRVLTKEEYGTYSQGLLIVNFLTPLLMLGMGNAINYFYNQKKTREEIQKYVNTIFSLVTIIGLVASVVLFFLRDWVCTYFNNYELYPLIILLAFRPWLQNVLSLYQPLFISNNMTKMLVARNLIVSVIKVTCVAVILRFINDLSVIFLLLLVLDALQVVFFEWMYRKKFQKISLFVISSEYVSEIFKYAIPLALSGMVATVSINMDKMLIGTMMTTEDFAVYSNMAKELPFSFVISSLTTVVTPVLLRLKSANQMKELKSLWGCYLELGYIITIAITSGAILCGRELLIFLYSDKYLEGLEVFLIYLLVDMVRFTYFGMILIVYGKTKWVLLFSISSLLINLALNVILFELWGMVGPAFATLLSLIINSGLQLFLAFRLLDEKVRNIIDIKKLFLFISKVVLVYVSVNLLKKNVLCKMNNNLLILIMTYGLYVVIVTLLEFGRIRKLLGRFNAKI